MKWEGGKQSENLEDRRRSSPRGLALGGGGILIVLLISAFLGIDPQKILQFVGNVQNVVGPVVPGAANPGQADVPLSPEEERSRAFSATILGYTEEVWGELFQQAGEQYKPPRMVLFSSQVQTGCGTAPSSVGPFYCPADQTVYLDPTFFTELEQKLGGSQAEFSQAYVIAHEIGHHVQNLLGYSQIVDRKRESGDKAEGNRWSVRLELQADYLAGVWAHHGQQKFDFIEPGDVAAAMQSAQAIGDDRLQRNSRGFTSPESYTHGTSEQRVKWFRLGLQTGDLSQLKKLFELSDSQL